MSNTVIKIENLSKSYRLGEFGTGTISHDLNRYFARIRGKEDPYAKVIKVNDRAKKGEKGDSVWALRNIDLEIKQGEMLGIIGLNGAGKSTLLKILSRITAPSTGSIRVKGRLAGLLEVGTGFHPEMTGRENIYMNGTIMGMRKWEIDRKLDEIVEFAGVAKYLDTPTKRYSSGMTVRLGFAVAAFLEPDILVVDEVLAVGDFEFQRKAINRMDILSREGGRTVLFVSHVMDNIAKICSKAVVLNKGSIIKIDDVESGIETYSKLNSSEGQTKVIIDDKSIKILNSSIEFLIKENEYLLKVEFNFTSNRGINKLDFSMHFYNESNVLLFVLHTLYSEQKVENGQYRGQFIVDISSLKEGRYFASLRAIENRANFEILRIDRFINFLYKNDKNSDIVFKSPGTIEPNFKFNLDQI